MTEITTNPIKEALKYCSKEVSQKEKLEEVIDEIDKLIKEKQFLERKLDQLLAIEFHAKTKIRKSIESIDNRLPKLIKQKISLKYPTKLSTHVFKWRNKKGFPSLAIFDPFAEHDYEAVCQIENSSYIRYPMGLPYAIREAMLDGLVQIVPSKSRGLNLAMEFKGLIPYEIREKILTAREEFKQLDFTECTTNGHTKWHVHKVFVVTEAAWEEGRLNIDPLVIGWDGKECRLIASFDLTTLENYIKSEFSS